jgi:ECF sigma factor
MPKTPGRTRPSAPNISITPINRIKPTDRELPCVSTAGGRTNFVTPENRNSADRIPCSIHSPRFLRRVTGVFVSIVITSIIILTQAPLERLQLPPALGLYKLTRIKPRLTEIVELRYFGGLNVEEAAEVLKVHPNTVIRDFMLAKAWLKRELEKLS